MSQTLIEHATILTMNANMDVLTDGYLIFEDDRICAVGKHAPKHFEGERRDAHQAILMPGMINTHTHIGMIPFRSLGDDCPDRLRRFLFPLENACMNASLASLSGAYAAMEMLLGGVTCFADMYYFEPQIWQVLEPLGVRALLGETVIDFATCDTKQAFGGLTIAESMLQKAKSDRLRVMIAPHATNTVTSEVLKQVDALSQKYDVPWMMHVSEMDYEMAEFRRHYDMTPVEYLAHIGVLSPRLIMAHAIHLEAHDIELLKKYDVAVAHCIGANTKAAKGVAPVKKLLEVGIRVGLGTDGPSSGNTLDLFVQMRLFASFHKTWLKDRAAFPSQQIVWLATMGGAQALGLADQIGSLEKGKQADLVLVETDSVNMFPIYDPYAALVYSANAANVRDVYVAGKQLVKDRQLQMMNLADLKARLNHEMKAFRIAALKAREKL